MDHRRGCYKELLPLVVLVANECSNTGLFTLFKAASNGGLSNYVFVAYAYSVATILLFPLTFFYRRSRVVPPLSLSIISKIALLGLIGCSSQILGYAGISYSNPTLSSAISNLIPAFTFILAVLCRMEKIDVRTRTTQAKIVGSIISIGGAFIVTFYKGPSIIIAHDSPSLHLVQRLNYNDGNLQSVDRNWVIGAFLLTAGNVLLTTWFIVQVEILKEFPDELSMVCFYDFFAAIVAYGFGLILERNSSAWKLTSNLSLVSIVCTGIFNKFLSSAIYAWGIHLKGPVYVAMFKPLSIIIAVAMGVMFLGDILHVGSIIGATVISIGFYTVMWGKATEEKEEDVVNSPDSPTTIDHQHAPLLESCKNVNSQKNVDVNV